jgi:protein-histidine N-methyltransferase
MASAFSFGFSGDDIDIDNDIDEGSDQHQDISENPSIEDKPSNNDNKLFPAARHLLSDWVSPLFSLSKAF